jgi:pyridinium-3,5-biscarboxylic acid mononucleotide sulfurtransferase
MEGSEAAAAAMLDRLRASLAARGGVVVGFSGGVDSAVLAKAAHDALGPRALAVTVDSESFARRERAEAEAFARDLGLRWSVVEAREMDNPLYVRNGADRCFFCREEMSAVLRKVADKEGIATLAMGVNVDDLREVRPGHEAQRRAGVWWPLVEVGATKADVRAMARALGLGLAEKPSMACLSSRIAHGQPVTVEALRRVEAAEEWLRSQGYAVVRVRVQGDAARVEVAPGEVARLQAMAAEVRAQLQGLGFRDAAVDPRGYRPSGLAEGLPMAR